MENKKMNIDNTVNELIKDSVNNYLINLDHVFGGVVSRYNYAKEKGSQLYSNINTTDKENNITSYIYTESFRVANKEYELNMIVCDQFATVNLFEAIKNDEFKFNEITIDIYKRDNDLTMYALKNTRTKNEGMRIGFDKVEMLPKLCDYYDIDFKSCKTKEESLINGIDIFKKKKSNKILKLKK